MSVIVLQGAQPVVGRLGWALVHFLWQGVLIACLYLIARTLLVRPENARIRYALSCAALAAMMAAPVITFATNGRANPAPAIARMAGPYTARPVAGPHSGSIPFEALPATATATPITDGMTWLVAIWLIGASGFSIRLIGGCLVASRLRSLEGAPVPPEWRDAWDSLLARTRLAFPVRLMVSGFVQTPAVVGWLKPAILLPAAANTRVLDAEEKARYTADYAPRSRVNHGEQRSTGLSIPAQYAAKRLPSLRLLARAISG